MIDLFKEFPFTFSGALVAAALAAWIDWPWWAILICLVLGFLIGAGIDGSSRKG